MLWSAVWLGLLSGLIRLLSTVSFGLPSAVWLALPSSLVFRLLLTLICPLLSGLVYCLVWSSVCYLALSALCCVVWSRVWSLTVCLFLLSGSMYSLLSGLDRSALWPFYRLVWSILCCLVWSIVWFVPQSGLVYCLLSGLICCSV